MANYKGSEGFVKIGANTVAEIRDWSLTMSADTIEDTVMGETVRTFKSSLTTATGSVTAYYDDTDSNGQALMDAGDTPTLLLYFDSDSYYSVPAIITERGVSSSFDGMVETTFSFQASAAVTLN